MAREAQSAFIDAYVTEIDIPIRLTPDMDIDDVVAKRDYAFSCKNRVLNKAAARR